MRPRDFIALMERPRLRRRPVVDRCASVEDFRREARRRLPRPVFDFLDGGAGDETTLVRNRAAFDWVTLASRVMRDVRDIDLRTRILGTELPLPLVLGPSGATRIFRSAGELDVVRAAGAHAVPYAAATMGNTSLEEIASAATGPIWFQLYAFRDRGMTRELVARARQAGYTALILTVDTAVAGNRERDYRNGFTLPPAVGLQSVWDGLRHPRWSAQFLRGAALELPNLGGQIVQILGKAGPTGLQYDDAITWDDVAWVRDVWDGPIVVKGVMRADDARAAAAAGVSAIVVSNHGGRQLDGQPATIEVLPDVVAAVEDRVEVMIDSGIRRGIDIVKALSLGARGCLVARPYLYGLAAAGQPGVERVIEMLADELRRAMVLVGARSIADLNRTFVRLPGGDPFPVE